MLRARVDRNHAEIVAALRAHGFSVASLARLGKGTPDLLVGAHGQNVLLEVKADKGKVNPDQAEWMHAWRGSVAVVRSVEEAVAAVTARTRGAR